MVTRKTSLATALMLSVLCIPAFARKRRKWPTVPCQKVFVTGSQVHEIAWALKGNGLENNLYKHTCLEPVPRPGAATAVLDLEWDPKFNPVGLAAQAAARRKEELENPDYFVTCSSFGGSVSCTDGEGNVLETNCDAAGYCTSYYGPGLGKLASELVDAWVMHLASTDAWVYLFSRQGHTLLYKNTGQGMYGWWGTLSRNMGCKHKGIEWHHFCKAPTALLP